MELHVRAAFLRTVFFLLQQTPPDDSYNQQWLQAAALLRATFDYVALH